MTTCLIFYLRMLRLFADSKKLCSVNVGHNRLSSLPAEYDVLYLEELYFQQNEVSVLPADLLQKAFRYILVTASYIQTAFTIILMRSNFCYVYTQFVISDITCLCALTVCYGVQCCESSVRHS